MNSITRLAQLAPYRCPCGSVEISSLLCPVLPCFFLPLLCPRGAQPAIEGALPSLIAALSASLASPEPNIRLHATRLLDTLIPPPAPAPVSATPTPATGGPAPPAAPGLGLDGTAVLRALAGAVGFECPPQARGPLLGKMAALVPQVSARRGEVGGREGEREQWSRAHHAGPKCAFGFAVLSRFNFFLLDLPPLCLLVCTQLPPADDFAPSPPVPSDPSAAGATPSLAAAPSSPPVLSLVFSLAVRLFDDTTYPDIRPAAVAALRAIRQHVGAARFAQLLGGVHSVKRARVAAECVGPAAAALGQVGGPGLALL